MSKQTFVPIAADTFLTPVLAHLVLLARDCHGRRALRWLLDWRGWCWDLLLGRHDSERQRLLVDISWQGAAVRVVIALAKRGVMHPRLLLVRTSLERRVEALTFSIHVLLRLRRRQYLTLLIVRAPDIWTLLPSPSSLLVVRGPRARRGRLALSLL